MAIKISYEWCLETLDEYEPGEYDIVEPVHASVGDKTYNIQHLFDYGDEYLFHFSIKKWFHNTWYDEHDWEHIYFTEDGTFDEPLPKYVMKEFLPYKDIILSHKNFRV